MFDTVNFWIDRAEVSEGNPFGLMPYLSEITERQNEKTGYSCSGKIGDYKVNIFDYGVYLNGSLAKYFLPSNVYTLTRSATQQAIEQLSDHLHTDIRRAIVKRADVSTIIPTKHSPSDYYCYLGEKTFFKRLHAAETSLYYNTSQRQLIFYDKVKECNKKGVSIPPSLEGNILRYELRFLQNLDRQLKTEVTGKTLYNEDFYYSIIQYWYNEFKSIQKLKKEGIMIDDVNNKKDAKEAAFAYLLQKEQGFIDWYIRELKAAKRFKNRSDYTKLKTELSKINVAKNGNNNEMIKELEDAVFRVSMYAR